jgi:uncharacterized protein YPO0396
MNGIKDLKAFQLEQAREKRERELAEREREKLELQHRLDLEADELRRVREYAIARLQKAREAEALEETFDS